MEDTPLAAGEPIDPDIGMRTSSGTIVRSPRLSLAVGVVAAGGVIGSVARYELGMTMPTRPGQFPATTLSINVIGCALMGVLIVLVSDVFTGQPLLRPFLGTGVLGGFTTFSTYAVDSQRLMATGHAGIALANLGLTVLVALIVVTATTRMTRRLIVRTRR